MPLHQYHLRNSSADSSDIHHTLSRMPSFFMEDDEENADHFSKWSKLKSRLTKVFRKHDPNRSFMEEGDTDLDSFEREMKQSNVSPCPNRKKVGLARTKSFKKEADLPRSRKTSLPTSHRHLLKKWEASRHKPKHPPLIQKKAHPLSYICSSQNPIISLPNTMTSTLDQLEDMPTNQSLNAEEDEASEQSEDADRVAEWVQHTQMHSTVPSSPMSSFTSDSSWTPFLSQPAMPVYPVDEKRKSWIKPQPQMTTHAWTIDSDEDASLDAESITMRPNSQCTSSNQSTPVPSMMHPLRQGSMQLSSFDYLKRHKSLFDVGKKRKTSICLSEAVHNALNRSISLSYIEQQQGKAFGLLEALQMDVDDQVSEEEEEADEQVTFMEALMEHEASKPMGRMRPKTAGIAPKFNHRYVKRERCSIDVSTIQDDEISDVAARHSMELEGGYSPELLDMRDSALFFGDEQEVYILE